MPVILPTTNIFIYLFGMLSSKSYILISLFCLCAKIRIQMNADIQYNDENSSQSTAPHSPSNLFMMTLNVLRNRSIRDRLLGIQQQKGILTENEKKCWLKLKCLCDRLQVSSVFKESARQVVGEQILQKLKEKGYLKQSTKGDNSKIIITIQV